MNGGFKFGALSSQPSHSTVTVSGQQPTDTSSAADVAVTDVSASQSAVLASTQLSASIQPAAAGVQSQHASMLASMPLSEHGAGAVMSPAAEAGRCDVDDAVSGSEMPSCCHAVVPPVGFVTSTLAPAAAECDCSKSLVTSSSVIMPLLTSTPSYTYAAATAAAASPVFSLPLTTTFTQQPTHTSVLSFGQATSAKNSSRPLGVPAASAVQFSASGYCFVT